MRLLRSVIKLLLVLFVFCTSLVVFLLTTTPGLYLTVKTVGFVLPGKLEITGLNGRLIDEFSFKALSYNTSDFQITANQTTLHWHLQALLYKRLVIKKLTADEITFLIHEKKDTPPSSENKWHFPSLPIEINLKKAEINRFNLDTNFHKEYFKSLVLNVHLAPSQWEINQFHFIVKEHQINIMGYMQTQLPYQLNALLQIKPLSFPLLQGNIVIQGNFSRYQWTGNFKYPSLGHLSGSIEQGKNLQSIIDWANFIWPLKNKKPLHIDEGKLEIKGSWPTLLINLNGGIRKPISAHFQAEVHMQSNASQLTAKLTSSFADFNLNLKYNLQNFPRVKGHLSTHLQKNEFTPPELKELSIESDLKATTFEDLTINSQLTAHYLENSVNAVLTYFHQQLKGQLNIGSNKVALDLNLPELNFLAFNPQQKMNGDLLLTVDSLSFLKNLDPLITKIDGQLQAKLSIQGTFNQPKLIGDVNLTHGTLALPKLGIDLTPIELALHSQHQKWQAMGTVKSKENVLALTGKGEFSPVVKGEVTIVGQNFLFINTSEYSIHITPALTLEFAPSFLKLKGNILIPEALIKPQTFSSSVTLSDDAIFIDEKKKPDNPLNMETDIHITMGDKVALAVQGLQGQLVGALHLRQTAKTPLTAEGELNVKDGKYKAYGQDLVIEQGRLFFTGGIISNPSIQVKAIRQFNNTNNSLSGSDHLFDFNPSNLQTFDFGNKTTVGIEVAGRLNSPKVQLFSNPSTLSQADILSMLLLGKPANQANKSGGQLLLTAISALNLDSGTSGLRLLNQLKETLGVDINLQNNTQFNQKTNQSTDKTAVVVGKSLSKRLYLSYNMGLSQSDSNVLTLKYLLNKFFSLQVNASTAGSGIDLLYTRQKG